MTPAPDTPERATALERLRNNPQRRELAERVQRAAPWHFGKKIVPGGKKKPFWMNRWLAHPCADLALPFELGTRAMGHTNGR